MRVSAFPVAIMVGALLLVGCACNPSDNSSDNEKSLQVVMPAPSEWENQKERVAEDLGEATMAPVHDIEHGELSQANVEARSIWNLDEFFKKQAIPIDKYDKEKFIQIRPDDPPVPMGKHKYIYRYPYLYQYNTDGEVVRFKVFNLGQANELVVEDLSGGKTSKPRAADGEAPMHP